MTINDNSRPHNDLASRDKKNKQSLKNPPTLHLPTPTHTCTPAFDICVFY